MITNIVTEVSFVALAAEGLEEVGEGGFGHCVLGGEGVSVLSEEFFAFGIANAFEEARVEGWV